MTRIFSSLVGALVVLTTLVPGCATQSSSGSVYSTRQSRQEQTVRMGVVESVRHVTIEGTKGSVGAVAGGAIGGIGGSNVGGGKGQSIGSILGAIAGGVAGSAIEREATERDRNHRAPGRRTNARDYPGRRRGIQAWRARAAAFRGRRSLTPAGHALIRVRWSPRVTH